MQGEPSAWVDGGHWSTTEQVVAKRGDLLPLSTRGTVCESFEVKVRKKYHRSHHSKTGQFLRAQLLKSVSRQLQCRPEILSLVCNWKHLYM